MSTTPTTMATSEEMVFLGSCARRENAAALSLQPPLKAYSGTVPFTDQTVHRPPR
jgi:hypothetical protein